MPIEVFDFREDVRNLFITPQIRARFLRMQPGEVGGRHSHDLGHEVFLVLEGRCEMEIEGERVVLGPGQMCVAYADQLHEARVVGDEPMTMYLSVTPHVEPTHTQWDEAGRKRPPRYGSTHRAGRANLVDSDEPVEALAARLRDEVGRFAGVAQEAAEALSEPLDAVGRASRGGDRAAAKAALDQAWAEIYRLGSTLSALEATWNELAVRGGGEAP